MEKAMSDQVFTDHFGGCPHCGKNDGVLHVSREEWCYCDEHRTCWHVGSNLFSSWRDIEAEGFDAGLTVEQIWKANVDLLNTCEVVNPRFCISSDAWQPPKPKTRVWISPTAPAALAYL